MHESVDEETPRRLRVRRTQRERRDATVEKLMRATIACLNELGYAGTTTTRIAARAGVTRGALQHHFATKDDLLLEVLRHVSQRLQGRLAGMARSDAPLALRCRTVVEGLWEVFGSAEYTAVLELMLGSRNKPQLHQAVMAMRVESIRRQDPMWAALFADVAAPRDQVRGSRFLVWASLQGLSVQMLFPQAPGFAEAEIHLVAKALRHLLEEAGDRADPPTALARTGATR